MGTAGRLEIDDCVDSDFVCGRGGLLDVDFHFAR